MSASDEVSVWIDAGEGGRRKSTAVRDARKFQQPLRRQPPVVTLEGFFQFTRKQNTIQSLEHKIMFWNKMKLLSCILVFGRQRDVRGMTFLCDVGAYGRCLEK